MKHEQFVFVWLLSTLVSGSSYRGDLTRVVHLHSKVITLIWAGKRSVQCAYTNIHPPGCSVTLMQDTTWGEEIRPLRGYWSFIEWTQCTNISDPGVWIYCRMMMVDGCDLFKWTCATVRTACPCWERAHLKQKTTGVMTSFACLPAEDGGTFLDVSQRLER